MTGPLTRRQFPSDRAPPRAPRCSARSPHAWRSPSPARAAAPRPPPTPARCRCPAPPRPGLHNTYDPAAFSYLAQALDTGTSMIELDVWDDFFTQEWKVSHSNPPGNSNNCVNASSASQLYTGGANKDLESCLDDVRVWLGAHPGHGPLIIKLEMKAGFQASLGLSPAKLDQSISAHLGSLVFKPNDLLNKPGGGQYATLDEAARAGNWPTRAAARRQGAARGHPRHRRGVQPDRLAVDRPGVRDLPAGPAHQGKTAQANVFPSAHGAQAGDPRTRYADTTLRPVVRGLRRRRGHLPQRADRHGLVRHAPLSALHDRRAERGTGP